MKKKIIALVLAVMMLLSIAPTFAMAASLGDVDSNGKIDATDARTALRAAVGLDKLTDAQALLADVDFDDDVDATDARLILRAAVGLEELHAHSYTSAVTKAATCEDKGVKTFTCSCGDSYTEEIPALGHKSVTDKAVAPTCAVTGKTEGAHCSVCNKVLKAQEKVNALGHKSVTDKAVAPTCTESGLTEGAHCSVCNEVIKKQEKVPATGHTTVTDKAVAATCTASGLTEGAHCSVCNTVLKAQETVPATGHTSVTDKAVAATCTATGKTEGAHCSVCNTVLKPQALVNALGHTSVTDKAVAPTCTESGLTEGSHCSVCKVVLKAQETVPATGHKKSTLDASTVVAENCTNDGYSGDYKCDACGAVTATGSVIPKAEDKHYYEKVTVPASCLADEYTVWECIYCEHVDPSRAIEESGKYPYGTGHTFGAKTTVAPTCEEDGYDMQVCSVCTYEERTNPTAAAGHNYRKNNKESVTATCLVAGKKVSVCSVCQDVKTEELGFAACSPVTAKVAGASYANGDSCKTVEKCSVCSKVIAETANYGAHRVMMATGPATVADCENAGIQTLRCEDCAYEYIAVVEDALGHSNTQAKPATCDEPGYIISSGVCTRDGCGKDLGEGTRIDIPAKGHRESGVQSCSTDVICLECNKVTQPRFGHNFTITSNVITSGSKNIETFFCARCGEGCEDKLATFNALTDRIKNGIYDKYEYPNGYPKLTRFIKTSAENIPSNINFGIWTSIVRDMFTEEMENTPVIYDRILSVAVIGSLPVYGEDHVSILENKDVDSITVERVSGLEFSKVLAGFDDKFTVNKTEYDLTPYKAIKVNGNVIKVTVDVKNEKYYGGIDRLPAAEQTSLQKIFGVDVREQLFSTIDCNKNCPENCAEHHYVKGSDGKLYMETNQEGMGMKMTLKDMSTDGKVTYYFLEENYEPIIAVYEEAESMNQSMEMEINVGLVIRGKMDTLSTTNSTTVYVFPNYTPAA